VSKQEPVKFSTSSPSLDAKHAGLISELKFDKPRTTDALPGCIPALLPVTK
jgi:hypothetical protein